MLKTRANFDEDIGADGTFEDVGISLRTFLLSQVSVEVWATEMVLTELADPTKFVRGVFVQNKFPRSASKKPRLTLTDEEWKCIIIFEYQGIDVLYVPPGRAGTHFEVNEHG